MKKLVPPPALSIARNAGRDQAGAKDLADVSRYTFHCLANGSNLQGRLTRPVTLGRDGAVCSNMAYASAEQFQNVAMLLLILAESSVTADCLVMVLTPKHSG
jgi:hypothetical protein